MIQQVMAETGCDHRRAGAILRFPAANSSGAVGPLPRSAVA